MPSPDDYRRAAGGRISTATGLSRLDVAPQPTAPIRQASPENDDAPPALNTMISRSTDSAWLPAAWLKAVSTNDDPILLKGGEGLKLYDALLTDETAMSTLQQRRLAITSKEYEVVPGDDADPRSIKAADDFRVMIDALGFDRVTGLLHYAVWYGYAVGEGLYTIKEHDGRLIVWLDNIVVPDRRHYGFTLEGELRLVDALTSGIEGEALPDNKFLTIRTGGTHDFAFYGLGLAHWCYWPIFFKRAAIKFWALYLEKLGRPTVAIGFEVADKDDTIKKGQLLDAAMSIGQDSAVLLPADYIKNELVKIFESQRSGNNVQGYKDFVTENNEAIMRVVLGQPGTSKGVSSGLNSDQASEHAGVKEEIVKADSDLITDAIGSTFGKWVTRWNHGEDVKPPIVRRILKAGEDLTSVADRDVKLDGIGIRRSEDSIKATYGDGYEVDRETTAEKNARETALAQAKAGALAPPAANDNPAEKRRRIAEFAAQGGDKPFSPLYVSRKLTPKSARELIAWAKSQGIASTVPADDLHCTILYSKTPVDWFDMAGEGWDSENSRVAPGGVRFVERFGHGEADAPIVLRFNAPDFRWRHDRMIEAGASSDYPEYKAHITISYDAPDLDLAGIDPFVGELVFGPEIFEPIKEKPAGDEFHAFTAQDEEAIDRLIRASVEQSSPLFEAIGEALRGRMQGVTTVEGARVALLGAMEQFDPTELAKALALPMLAERAAASIGADEMVDA
jgi:phage gp29-like protein